AEDGIRDRNVTGVQTCALPIFLLKDVLPYILSYTVMAFVLQVAGAILAEAALSMLGLGPSGADSLGTQLHWALAFQAVASGAWWAFLPPTIRSEERRVGKGGRARRAAR